MTITAIVPIRSFAGLTRLSRVLDEGERVSLMRQLAAHTVSAIQSAGIEVLIVSNDSDVVLWSRKYGC
ncbi:MAG: hypothetical protein U9R51_04895, partial [Actinomycetota bacterium]|nr:hypothetical protein [Actinomycetota bacterium]